jgi:hypothetical protein
MRRTPTFFEIPKWIRMGLETTPYVHGSAEHAAYVQGAKYGALHVVDELRDELARADMTDEKETPMQNQTVTAHLKAGA